MCAPERWYGALLAFDDNKLIELYEIFRVENTKIRELQIQAVYVSGALVV